VVGAGRVGVGGGGEPLQLRPHQCITLWALCGKRERTPAKPGMFSIQERDGRFFA